MKKIITMALIVATSSVFAQSADDLKEMALKACDTQMEQVPAEMKDKAIETCKCTVEKTDYKALMEAQKSGNTEQVEANAIAAAQECAKESM